MKIQDLIRKQANLTPNHDALSAGKTRWNYAKLWEEVRIQTEKLRQWGVQPGELCALLRPNSPEWIRDALSVLALGAILMPMHPELTPHEQKRFLQSFSPHWLLASELRKLSDSSELNFDEDTFYLGLTSGSTGTPKGLLKTHRSWTCSYRGWTEAFSLHEEERVLIPLHLSYSAHLYAALHGLSTGAEVILLPRFSPDTFLTAESTYAVITPALIEALVQYAEKRARGRGIISPAKVISVGNKLTPSQRSRFSAVFPETRLYEYYGSSEMGYVTLATPEDAVTAPESVGRPFPNVEVAFFNDLGNRLAPGQEGKLYVRTEQAFQSYVGLPEETAAAFSQDRLWVTSHDVGYEREDGRIVLLGRAREVIKSGGSLVYAGEVENLLAGLAGVRETAVFAGPDPTRGEAVWAAVSLFPDYDLAEVRKACLEYLAPYKRPRRWGVFEALPKNRNGKVDKLRLRQMME